jgi:hypothetical protein
MLYVAQLFLPFLLVISIRGLYQQNNDLILLNIPDHTKWLVWIICILGFVYNLTRFVKSIRNNHEKDFNINEIILWPSVVAISAFLTFRISGYSSFATDDFHLGELILPWDQIMIFGQNAYTQFVSVQGLLGISYGGLNYLLFDGSASSFPLTMTTMAIIITALVSFLFCRVVGTGWALILAIAIFPVSDRTYLLMPIILILLNKRILSQPLKWILVWLWLSLLHCFYNPSVGSALTFATIPVFIFMVVRLLNSGELKSIWHRYKLKFIVIASVNIVLLALVLPYCINLLKFLLDNGSMNTMAYGVGLQQYYGVPDWFPTWFTSLNMNKFLWEGFRVGGWILAIIVLWYTVFKNVYESNLLKENRLQIIMFCLVSLIFMLFMIPYSLGRVDVNSMSRTGTIALIAFGSLLPIAFIFGTNFRRNAFLTVVILGIVIGLKNTIVYTDFKQLPLRSIENIIIPSDTVFVRGSELGLPKLGDIYMKPDRLKELQILKQILDKFLVEGETYADLTNRSLLYYALNKRVPSLYSADYLAANYAIQNKMVNEIKGENPPIVLIGPSIRIDGGPSSLRSYRVYKWFMEQDYRYYEENGFQFLVRGDRLSKLLIPQMTKNENIEKLTGVFHQKELLSIPLSWGRSFKKLESRFKMGISTNGNSLSIQQKTMNSLSQNQEGWNKITGNDPFLTWELKEKIAGNENDFIKIEIETKNNKTASFRGEFFWTSDNFTANKSFAFNVVNGVLLIPLGSSPDWIKSDNISEIRFDVDNFDGDEFRIKSLSFLKLVK